MKLVLEQEPSHEFTFDTKVFKHSSNVECAENVRSSHIVECKLRHIPTFCSANNLSIFVMFVQGQLIISMIKHILGD